MIKLVTTIREYTEYKVLHRRVLVSVKSVGMYDNMQYEWNGFYKQETLVSIYE